MACNTTDRRQKYRARAREKARERRCSSKSLMEDLSCELPFPKCVVDTLDQSSRLRLAMCYIRMKNLFGQAEGQADNKSDKTPPISPPTSTSNQSCLLSNCKQMKLKGGANGVIQDLFMEVSTRSHVKGMEYLFSLLMGFYLFVKKMVKFFISLTVYTNI